MCGKYGGGRIADKAILDTILRRKSRCNRDLRRSCPDHQEVQNPWSSAETEERREWLAREVELLASSVTAPESGGRQPRIRHDVDDPLLHEPQHDAPPTQGTKCKDPRPRRLMGIPAERLVLGTAPSERETKELQPHQPATGTHEPGAPAPSQTSDSRQQAQPSATG